MDERETYEQKEVWLSPAKVSALLPGRPTAQTVRQWARLGKLPNAWKSPGGQWRIPLSTVELVLAGDRDA